MSFFPCCTYTCWYFFFRNVYTIKLLEDRPVSVCKVKCLNLQRNARNLDWLSVPVHRTFLRDRHHCTKRSIPFQLSLVCFILQKQDSQSEKKKKKKKKKRVQGQWLTCLSQRFGVPRYMNLLNVYHFERNDDFGNFFTPPPRVRNEAFTCKRINSHDWPSEVIFANGMATSLPNLEFISQIVKELFKIKWRVALAVELSICIARLWSAQRRLWTDWADAQADQSLCWAHRSCCWFCHDAAHIMNNEIFPPNLGYSICREDRICTNGNGVFIMVKSAIMVSEQK